MDQVTKEIRTVGIIAIGNELLDGKVLETNSNWMESRLLLLGLEIKRLASVRDEIAEIGRAVEFVRENCDVIIISGGLGPTYDDMTLRAIAEYLGLELTKNPDAMKIIKRQYETLHKKGIVQASSMTDRRLKMALLPEGSHALDNRVGGAPGVMIQDKGTTIFCLPGVPSELQFIFEDSVVPWLSKRASQRFHEKFIEFGMRDESTFAPAIDIVMKKVPGVWIKSLPKTYGTSKNLRVWVSARGDDDSELVTLIQKAISELEKAIGIKSSQVE
jgi:molybdenum cofactor synthesis domain-containing protein